MATKIRMRRGGRTHEPYYRVVVIDSRNAGRGLQVDTLGIYHPCAKPEPVSEIDEAKAIKWLQDGAQPSETVRSVMNKLGIMAKYAALRDGKTVEAAVEAAPAVAPEAEAVSEAPAEEAAPEAEAVAEETPAVE